MGAAELANQLAGLDALLRVEAGGRLVEDEDVGVVDDGLGEPDALPIALGQLGAVAGGHVGHPRLLHRLVDARS